MNKKMFIKVTVVSLLITGLILSCSACGMGPNELNDSKGSAQASSNPYSDAVSGASGQAKDSSKNADTKTVGTGRTEKTIEPSTLITQDQAEKLVGDKVAESRESDITAQGIKQYVYDFDNQSTLIISIYQESTVQSGITPEQKYNSYKEYLGERTSGIKVDGMADEAYVYLPGAQAKIYIWDKGYLIFIEVIVNPEDNDKRVDILKQAGQIAVVGLESALK